MQYVTKPARKVPVVADHRVVALGVCLGDDNGKEKRR
jgi:hypothetical protein